MFWPIAMGFGLACVATVTLGFSTALAAPSVYLGWFKSIGSQHVGRMLWDLMVVGALGLGVPAFVAALAAFKLGGARFLDGALFALAALLSSLILLPWLHNGIRIGRSLDAMARPWWTYGVELSLMLATLAALARVRAR
ncbi:hypothetical protein [Pseudorhodoferax sp. Leaf267]|uniref:hypothetical protein n=1 Tax=Pseudorhodoferax sp. Leaf267 TaxID=1736316 RepID=UPI0006F1E2AF|nr:hypothetical protein [Pseudorhodoferax sp. Leaf267]KQP15172.1 hypothetical protein ASF43_14205 [Pseudorhodoferax sp. Leaf267]